MTVGEGAGGVAWLLGEGIKETDWRLSEPGMDSLILFLFPSYFWLTNGLTSYFSSRVSERSSISAPQLYLSFLRIVHHMSGSHRPCLTLRRASPTPVFTKLFAIHRKFLAFVISFRRCLEGQELVALVLPAARRLGASHLPARL